MGILYKKHEVQTVGSNNLVLVLKQESIEYMMKNVFSLSGSKMVGGQAPEEKTNTDCLVKEQEKEYQTGWKIKKGNVLDSGNQRNMGFNESGEYKKTFIGSGVGTGLMHVLHGFEFEVEPLGDHTFEVEPQENVDQRVGLQEVQTQDLMDYQLARHRDQHLACELFGYREDSNEVAFAISVVEKIYAHESLTFNDTVSCEAEIWVTKGLLIKANGNVLGLEIIRNQSGNTLRVSQSRMHNKKSVQTLLKGHSTLSLEDSLSGGCDVEKNASAGVDMLNGFDRSLQRNIQVFVDFDYAMGRSMTVMSRSITRYGLMILGCARSLKVNLQHMEALSTEAGYMTFTQAWKRERWLK
ncbi:hypothetical protein Tco_1156331 [Tanacetum coccineum]